MPTIDKIREAARKLNPIDDPMFTKMAESKPFCEEILRTFLEEPDLEVITNTPQKLYVNLQGRSIRVDVVCDISTGQVVNVEVEKNRHDHWNRVVYNSAIITTNTADTPTNPGDEFKDIPRVIVVYITKSDFFKLGLAKYVIDEVVRGLNVVVNKEVGKVFINGAVDDGSAIARLMRIFTKSDEYDNEMFPVTSELKNHYKNTDEGVSTMSNFMRDLFHDEFAKLEELSENNAKLAKMEGVEEGKSFTARNLLQTNMPHEQIAKMTGLKLSDIEALAAR